MKHRALFLRPLIALSLVAVTGKRVQAQSAQPPSVLPGPAALGAPLKPAEESALPVIPPPPAPEPAPPANPGVRNDWRHIVIHHSASPSGNAAKFDRMHKGKGWDGLAYHFVINNGKGGGDGQLEVGQRWWKQKHGAHAGGLSGAYGDEKNEYNEFGIGICLVGNLDRRPPTRKQLETLARLVRKLQAEFGIPEDNIVGHRHVKSTACPGRHFPWKKLWALMDLPTPQHLYKRHAVATFEHCAWCEGAEVFASTDTRTPLGGLNPTRPVSDVPPQIILNAR